MMLTAVTLTGADNSVRPSELCEMSLKFPFVEWGILVGSHGGVPRFPSAGWFASLAEAGVECNHHLAFSLHICGRLLRSLLQESDFPIGAALKNILPAFRRAQLNFHGEPVSREQCDKLILGIQAHLADKEIIVQLDGVNDWVLDKLLQVPIRASGLYDVSHGAGVLPSEWPRPNPYWEVGYAGGLGPDNVLGEIKRIAEAAGEHRRFWIDMETKLRSQRLGRDTFDLWKCGCVLDATQDFFSCNRS